ncbi:MAG TPA: hypothetical protein VEN81_15945 [Planctomycetota bacterium]|nr:hypothetical protein [Planctomycetota bacterium]
MRRRTAGGGRKSSDAIGVRITPSMRRKVDDLARWLAGGEVSQLRAARAAVVQLLRNVSRPS